MKTKALLSLFILFHFVVTGQNRYHIFKTYPTNLPIFYEFNLAYETNFDYNNGIEILLGSSLKEHIYHVPIATLSIFGDYDYNADEALPALNILSRISYKRYFGKGNYTPFRFFLSTQLLLKYAYVEGYKYCDCYDGEYYELVDIHKEKIGINFLLGKNYGKNNFTLGWHIGLGLRYTHYTRIQYWEEFFPYYEDSNNYFYHEGKNNSYYGMFKPSLNFGICFGYYNRYQ